VAAILWLVFELRDRRRLGHATNPASSHKAEVVVRDRGNSTASATGGSVSFYLQPNASATAPAAEDEPEPIPSLDFIDYERAQLFPDSAILRTEDRGSHLLTAQFCNTLLGVGQITPTADRVRAQLTYRTDKGKEISVHHGTSMGIYTHFAQFGPGKVHNLVVVLRAKDGTLYTLENHNAVDPRTRRFRSGLTILHAPRAVLLVEAVYSVAIALVEGKMTLYQHEFVLTSEPNGVMRLA
jgi:hypothetical protein